MSGASQGGLRVCVRFARAPVGQLKQTALAA